ncbi:MULTISPECIES: YfkD famly protein [Bacillaceae]|uniref:YfkD family protein n=1 Tax=Evansella alkalicola TaxID=745819 RepID=A0ABS6JXS2_9BACI|nr:MULTISPECIES: YfkD famly protein [Bacillaceae]MBU9722896.1 YfkD family protein [Bacillus alkalicola]
MKKILLSVIVSIVFMNLLMPMTFAEEGKKEEEKLIPDSALDISKDNTYPNPTQDLPKLHPSELATELLDSTDITIENPELIKMFNESTIKGSKLAIGMNVSIYLGQWPLAYESEESKINWDYEKVNTNVLDNRGGNEAKQINYNQEQQKRIKGGLTAEIPNGEMVQKMMLLKASDKLKMPLSFSTVIGYATKADRVYNVSPKMMGYLTAYAPAVNEKGKVTYGEVYLRMKGDKKWLEVKNVTQQGIGAWIPVQDYVNLKIQTTKQPK